MAEVTAKGACLVARAVPLENQTDQVIGLLDKLSIDENAEKGKINKIDSINSVTPSDFVTLQSIRSSALARKTNTTSKFSRAGPALFADLLNKDAKPEVETGTKDVNKEKEIDTSEKKSNEAMPVNENKINTDEKDNNSAESELLSRGPVRNVRAIQGHHPYNYGQIPYGTAALTAVSDISVFAGYGNGYECGSTWAFSPDTISSISASTTPDTTLSSEGYGSSSPSQNSPKVSAQSPFSDVVSNDNSSLMSPENNELPESLQDFILQYSNQYTKEENTRPSTDSGVSSPMSAKSAPYSSPRIPQSTRSSPTTPSRGQTRLSPQRSEKCVTAKQKLHALIKETDLAGGFHWACTMSPPALSTRDTDGDTPLHIVVAHLDLGKVYALCETLRKTASGQENPFCQTNNFGETPLFIAVLKRSAEVVDYLLELGASPNIQTMRADRDTALHHAAARGMSEITKIMVKSQGIRLNELNARGQTALLSSVKNHNVFDEETNCKVDNLSTIETLIRAGSDCTIAESTTGRTLVHYAVLKMDVELLDLLKKEIPEDTFTDLANQADFHGESAVDILSSTSHIPDITENVRQDIYIRLLASGAIGSKY